MSPTCALLGLLALVHLAGAQITLETNPPSFYNLDQNRPIISCSLKGIDDPSSYTLSWVGPNSLTNGPDLQKKHRTNSDQNGLLDLEFTSFDDQQLGTYYCLAVSSSNIQPSYNSSLEVFRDAPPALLDCPSSQTFVEGATGKIVCRFNHRHKLFDLTLNKENGRAGNRYKHDEASSSYLIDGSVKMSDAGDYNIVARYRPDPSKRLFPKISVNVLPATLPNQASTSSGAGTSGQALNSTVPDYTPWIVGMVIVAAVLILLDLMCCVCYNIGMAHLIRSKCCPSKTTSVINDKVTPEST